MSAAEKWTTSASQSSAAPRGAGEWDAFGRKGFLVCCTANGINTKNKPLAHYSFIPDFYLKTQMPALLDISEASLMKTVVRSVLIRSRTLAEIHP